MAKTRRTRQAHGAGSVFQRKSDGFWVAQVLTGYENGRPKYKARYRKEQAEAVKALQEMQATMLTGRALPEGRVSVGRFLDDWLTTMVEGKREPKTVAYYRMMVERHIKPALGRIELRRLTAMHVQALLNEKSRADGDGKTLSPATVAGIRRTVRAALTKAWKLGLVAENVAQKTEAPKVPKGEAVYLSPTQAQALREAAAGHSIGNLVALAIGTGLRVGEATGLRWEDVDLVDGVLRVRTQLQRVGGRLALKSLKSTSSRRNLALSGMALEAVQAEQFRQAMLKADLQEECFNPLGLVFLNSEGRPLDPKYVDKHLKALCRKAGIPPVSFHKLRHTCATLLVSAGVSLGVVKDQLGHSSITLTSDTYSHAVPTALRQASETLDRVLRTQDPAGG